MITKYLLAQERIKEKCEVRTHHCEQQIERDKKLGKRFTEEQRVAMRKRIFSMRAEGLTREKIAEVLGVAPQTVTNWADK